MRRRIIGALVIALLIGGGIATVVSIRHRSPPSESALQTTEERLSQSFETRRSREALDKGIAAAKAERDKEQTSSAAAETDPEAMKARQMRDQLMVNQTADGAEATARAKLAEIDKQLETATAPEDRERLERHKRLVEEVLAKLRKIQ